MWGFSSLLKKNESVIVMNIVNDFSKVTIPLLVLLVISVGLAPSALAFHSPDLIGNPPAGPGSGTAGDTFSFKSSLIPAANPCPALDPAPGPGQGLPFPPGSCPVTANILTPRLMVVIDRGGFPLSVPNTDIAACLAAFPGSGLPPNGFFGHEANEPLFELRTLSNGGTVVGPNPVPAQVKHIDVFNIASQVQLDSMFGSGDNADTDDNVGPSVTCPGCAAANGDMFPIDAAGDYVWRQYDSLGALTANPDATATAGIYTGILCGCVDGPNPNLPDDSCAGDNASVQTDIFIITADVGGEILGINPVSALVAGAFTGYYWMLPILAVFGSLISVGILVREKYS